MVALLFFWMPLSWASAAEWQFAVSGDSRNCGDVVMPTIAEDAKKHGPQFYWHLGDFRWGAHVDEDILHDSRRTSAPSLSEYRELEWKDFIDNQVAPFDPVPVYLGIGNHELVGHTRTDFIATFAHWIHGGSIYQHWLKNGVDFISMDNASHEQFDSAQMDWFRKLASEDESNTEVKTIVIGMHEVLPDSLSFDHSMSESKNPVPVDTGREVYKLLLHARDVAKKHVYILASHSHFFMEGTFNTAYWKSHGGVLPGWIIGTAGAVRYPLPPDAKEATVAKTHVYGYLLGTAASDDSIRFDFKQLEKRDVPSAVLKRYGQAFTDFCFDQNVP